MNDFHNSKMQFITYFIASLISFSGLLIGVSLIKIAPEEQKPLEKYFSLLRKIFLLLIFIFAMFFHYNSVFYLLAFIAYMVFLILIEYKIDDEFKKSISTYAVLGILFFVSSKNLNLFVIESSLVLLYGISSASLMYSLRQKNLKKIFLHNLIFIVISNLLFFT